MTARKSTMQKQAKITSKGQITVPRDVRRALGVQAGDHLVFESIGQEVSGACA
jgi:AbrB family looped-hinge helix DNA binding protein